MFVTRISWGKKICLNYYSCHVHHPSLFLSSVNELLKCSTFTAKKGSKSYGTIQVDECKITGAETSQTVVQQPATATASYSLSYCLLCCYCWLLQQPTAATAEAGQLTVHITASSLKMGELMHAHIAYCRTFDNNEIIIIHLLNSSN